MKIGDEVRFHARGVWWKIEEVKPLTRKTKIRVSRDGHRDRWHYSTEAVDLRVNGPKIDPPVMRQGDTIYLLYGRIEGGAYDEDSEPGIDAGSLVPIAAQLLVIEDADTFKIKLNDGATGYYSRRFIYTADELRKALSTAIARIP